MSYITVFTVWGVLIPIFNTVTRSRRFDIFAFVSYNMLQHSVRRIVWGRRFCVSFRYCFVQQTKLVLNNCMASKNYSLFDRSKT